MAYGRRCAVAGPTVQRTGSRSFPIASASSVSRAVVVVRLAKRCSDTGILLVSRGRYLELHAGLFDIMNLFRNDLDNAVTMKSYIETTVATVTT